ncbi:hypothetical protein [Terrabacter sp. NPDC000476]|uniref:hypothetical protein n=1 Tax=Terrabacter sp. NPDC000476 TaxID=3154258 RepID=UPI00332AD053
MTTSTAPAPTVAMTGTTDVTGVTDVAGVSRPVVASGDRVPLLALAAPLLLFTHGILQWVDDLGRPADALRSGDATGAWGVAAGAVLVAAVAAFCWLATSLGGRLEHLDVATPAGVLAAFGAGATGTVWVGHTVGLLGGDLPTALTAGGPVLVGVAVATVLGALAVEARMPVRSLALAGVAALVLALPWGLEPLGALLLLIAFAPLLNQPEPQAA